MSNSQTKHISVMPQEVLEHINPQNGDVVVDCTLGGGGHLKMMIDSLSAKDKVTFLAFDQDRQALEMFKNSEYLSNWEKIEDGHYKKDLVELHLVNQNFLSIQEVLSSKQLTPTKILADLGVSQDQIEDDSRGFSFAKDAPLDMRMNTEMGVKASDLVNALTKKELVKLFTELADLGSIALKLSGKIVEERKKSPILTTEELRKVINKVVAYSTSSRTNSMKGTRLKSLEARVFQALRIAVNQELLVLRQFLPQAFETLASGGTMAIISFHSGEDRVVKDYFRTMMSENKTTYASDVITPLARELAANTRSSSAKMRVIKK